MAQHLCTGVLLLMGLALAGCATTVEPAGEGAIRAELAPPPRGDAAMLDARARQLFVRGLTSAQVGDHDRAVAYYQQALEAAPGEPAILSALADAHEGLGDAQMALFFAEQAKDRAPGNVYYHRQVAQLHLARGATDVSIAAYEELLEAFPDDYESRYDLARLLVVRGDFEGALAAFEALLERVGENAEVRNQMVQLQMRLGDDEGLEASLRAMVEADPTNTRLRRMLADYYAERDRPSAAQAELEAALADNPGDVQTVISLAELYQRQGRPAAADSAVQRVLEADYATADQLVSQARALLARADQDAYVGATVEDLLQEALRREPEHAEALALLGALRYNEAAYAEAGELLYRSLQVNPRDPDRWEQAAAAWLQAGDPDRAADVADEGLLLFPGQFALLRLSAYALMDAYRNVDAIRQFNEALSIGRADGLLGSASEAELLSALGLLHVRTQDHARSDSLYRAALAADASNAVALNNFAFGLAGRGEHLEEALGYAQRAVELEPENPSFLDTLGWVHFKLGDAREAYRWIEQAAEQPGASASVHEHLGDVSAALGRPAEARQHWQTALEMRPGNAALLRKLEGAAE